MKNLTELIGISVTPVGGVTNMPESAPNIVQDGIEWLRFGFIKTNDGTYPNAIANAPQLSVYGSGATSGTPQFIGATSRFGYVGTSYVNVVAGQGIYYSSDLITWIAATGTYAVPVSSRFASNGTSIVIPAGAATAHKYTTNGSTLTAVGGTFTTITSHSNVAYGNSWWMSASAMDGSAGSLAYINNANPSRTWAVGASQNLGMTAPPNGGTDTLLLSFGGAGNYFVAAGQSASATAGKLATATAPNGTWTDRTVSSGIPFKSGGYFYDLIYTGSYFLGLVNIDGGATFSSYQVWRAADPTGAWTQCNTLPISNSGEYPNQFAADAAGNVALSITNPNGEKSIFLRSTDHGLNWIPGQVWLRNTGISSAASISFANGKFISGYIGGLNTQVDMGNFASPAYIGFQTVTTAVTNGNYNMVRIK